MAAAPHWFTLRRHDGEPAADPPADPAPPAADASPEEPAKGKPDDDETLGEGGRKALEAERRARRDLARQLAEQTGKTAEFEQRLAELAPLADLVQRIRSGKPDEDKSEVEKLADRLDAAEKTVAEERQRAEQERLARLRLEVAAEKNLTPKQAARLVGGTREELQADADDLLATFPAPPPPPGQDPAPAGPGRPKPDPGQGGGREGPPTNYRDVSPEDFGKELASYGLRPRSR